MQTDELFTGCLASRARMDRQLLGRFPLPQLPKPLAGEVRRRSSPQPQTRPRGKPRAAGGRRTELPASGQQTRFLCQQFVLFETSCQHLKIRTFHTNIQISSFLSNTVLHTAPPPSAPIWGDDRLWAGAKLYTLRWAFCHLSLGVHLHYLPGLRQHSS